MHCVEILFTAQFKQFIRTYIIVYGSRNTIKCIHVDAYRIPIHGKHLKKRCREIFFTIYDVYNGENRVIKISNIIGVQWVHITNCFPLNVIKYLFGYVLRYKYRIMVLWRIYYTLKHIKRVILKSLFLSLV